MRERVGAHHAGRRARQVDFALPGRTRPAHGEIEHHSWCLDVDGRETRRHRDRRDGLEAAGKCEAPAFRGQSHGKPVDNHRCQPPGLAPTAQQPRAPDAQATGVHPVDDDKGRRRLDERPEIVSHREITQESRIEVRAFPDSMSADEVEPRRRRRRDDQRNDLDPARVDHDARDDRRMSGQRHRHLVNAWRQIERDRRRAELDLNLAPRRLVANVNDSDRDRRRAVAWRQKHTQAAGRSGRGRRGDKGEHGRQHEGCRETAAARGRRPPARTDSTASGGVGHSR